MNKYHIITLGDVEVSGKEFENVVVLGLVEGEEFTQEFDAITRYEIRREGIEQMTEDPIILDENSYEALSMIEHAIWKKAIRSVKCILPDDAEEVETAADEIRKEITRRISDSSTRH